MDTYLKLCPGVMIIENDDNTILLYKKTGNSLKLQSGATELIKNVMRSLRSGCTRKTLFTILEQSSHDILSNVSIHNFIELLQSNEFVLSENTCSESLSYEEKQYFDRTLKTLYQKYNTQFDYLELFAKLRSATVLMIGVGSLGSAILQNLLGLGIKNIILVDGDEVEASNLSRQSFYLYADIGKAKVIAAKEHAERISPFTRIDSLYCHINSFETLAQLPLQNKPDLIILTADTPSIDIVKWTHQFAKQIDTSVIRINRDTIGPITTSQNTACSYCDLFHIMESNAALKRAFQLRRNDKIISALSGVTASTLSLLGAYAADEIMKFLLKLDSRSLLINRKLKLKRDSDPKLIESISLVQNSKCTVCTTEAIHE